MTTTWDKVHQPCPLCGSTDAVGVNEDGSAKCFSCDAFMPNYEEACKGKNMETNQQTSTSFKQPDSIEIGSFSALTDRKITKDTAQKYGVKVVHDLQGNVIKHLYPFYNGHEVSATKTRSVRDKQFFWQGTKSETGLFGQQLFKGGKYITITEGECDAMSAYELLGSRWAVVSIKSGASGAVKDIKESLEFFDDFENVIIAFDNDKAGETGAEKAMAALPKGKAAIARLPEGVNDVNDLLIAKRGNELRDILWKAQSCRSDHIINGADAWDIFTKETSQPICDYPYPELQKSLMGVYPSQMITIAAGSGAGKSTLCRELSYHFLRNGLKVGYLALEESVQRTLLGLVGIDLNVPLHLNKNGIDEISLKAAFDKLTSSRSLFLYNHFGSIEPETLINQIRELATVDKVDVVILDHLTIVVSGVLDKIGDERKALDLITTKLRSLAEETKLVKKTSMAINLVDEPFAWV